GDKKDESTGLRAEQKAEHTAHAVRADLESVRSLQRSGPAQQKEQIGEPPGSPICFRNLIIADFFLSCGAYDDGATCCDDGGGAHEPWSLAKNSAGQRWIAELMFPAPYPRTEPKLRSVPTPKLRERAISSC